MWLRALLPLNDAFGVIDVPSELRVSMSMRMLSPRYGASAFWFAAWTFLAQGNIAVGQATVPGAKPTAASAESELKVVSETPSPTGEVDQPIRGRKGLPALISEAAESADERPGSRESIATGELPTIGAPPVAKDSQPLPLPMPENALPLRPPPSEAEAIEPPPAETFEDALESQLWYAYPWQAPNGYAGPSGVLPPDVQTDPNFVPIADRWRLGFPKWDRYGPATRVFPEGDPFEDDNPYVWGALLNPYQQNVLKGDYPIYGQHTFLNLTVSSVLTTEFRQVPTPTTPFESTEDPFAEEFFGDPDQFFLNDDFKFSFELVHGDAGFKPADWRLRVTPIVNVNYLDVEELAIVTPDVRDGATRYRTFLALEEFFFETKLADTSPHYDFVSVRAGSQPFVSDFRGFVFADINLAARLFGTRHANRDQYNVAYFDQFEKETNSALNRFDDRAQQILIANYFRQDFIWPGYTAQVSFHYNKDRSDELVFDRNGFLVRPDPAGVFAPHDIDAFYVGWTGEGHINRFNISHSFYYAFGEDQLNPLAGRSVDIDAQMAAVEVSYDRDWMRFRNSVFYASGDRDIDDDRGEGFDAILDNPAFAGGEFSYWQRQSIKLQGVNLVDRFSLVPHLRSSKIQGQTNFVNPGLFLLNYGIDAELTPRCRMINNVNLLWFNHTDVLEQFVFQANIDRHIGTDLSTGFEWRPLLNDNIIVVAGVSGLIVGDGFEDLFSTFAGGAQNMFASFVELAATY
jgi:hypothetical protein